MPIIEIDNIVKKYGEIAAVDGLSLNINEGEMFGLLGPNGAGKTTTLLMLTTLVKPTSGHARVHGFDVVKNPSDVRSSIGVVFQDPSSDDILTGYENLRLHGMLHNMPVNLREKRIKEVLELVDLTARKNNLVKEYSGGMRRRLELARGLMHHPKIIFFDEPTLGLDPQSRENIWEYIERLSKEEKITMIITTHYMDEADKLCDRIAIIDHGKIAALDTPENLKRVVGGDLIIMRTAFSDLSKLRKIEFVKNANYENGRLYMTIENASRNLSALIQSVDGFDSLEIHSPTLEDVFLHFVGRNIREESPEGGWGERMMSYRTKNK